MFWSKAYTTNVALVGFFALMNNCNMYIQITFWRITFTTNITLIRLVWYGFWAVWPYSLICCYGAKYLVFISSCSLKTRELSFAQCVYFLRKVCLFFNFWMIKFTIMSKENLALLSLYTFWGKCQTKPNCKFYHSKIEK